MSFAELANAAQNYPTEIPRVLGVTLACELRDQPDLAGRITVEPHVPRRCAVIEAMNTLSADKVASAKRYPEV